MKPAYRPWLFPVALGLLVSGSAQGATFDVDILTQTADASPGDGSCQDGSGNCSLLAAVQESSALLGSDTITLPAGTYDVSNTSMVISVISGGDTDVTTITGAGANQTFLDGKDTGHTNPLFDVIQTVHGFGRLVVSDLTIHNATHGHLATGSGGGAIRSRGMLSLTDVLIRDCVAANGGAIGAYGDLGTTLLNVSLIDNVGTSNGGAIEYRGPLSLDNVTISGNSTLGDGGAIKCSTATCAAVGALTINNSTIVYNTGLWAVQYGENGMLSNSILAENREKRTDASLPGRLRNCVGPGSPDEVTSGGYNFIQGGSTGGYPCGSTLIWNDGTSVTGFGGFVSNIIPRLAPVADNGGGILTNALLTASIGVDDGDPGAPGGCFSFDAHRTSRPQDGDGNTTAICDMGAFELPPPGGSADLAITNVATSSAVPAGGGVEYTITAVNNGPEAVAGAWVVDLLPVFVESGSWICVAAGGATCTAAGVGDLVDSVDLPVSGSVTYTLSATVVANIGFDNFDNHAYVGVESAKDLVPENNGATENVTIAENQPPVATADSYTTLESIPLPATDADGSIPGTNDDGVLVNDADDDGDTLSVTDPGTFTPGGIGGFVNLAADGTFTYTPDADAFGDATFGYTVSDGDASDVGSVTITVLPVNDAPSMTVGADIRKVAGTFGSISESSWVAGVDFGPNEGGQAVLDYLLTIDDDPSGVLTSIDVLDNGTLEAELSGASGSAVVGIRVMDDGGTANGGVDTSATETFSVSVDPPPEDVTVENETISESRVIEACGTLTVDLTTIADGIHVIFRATMVIIGNGFYMGDEATLEVASETPTACSA